MCYITNALVFPRITLCGDTYVVYVSMEDKHILLPPKWEQETGWTIFIDKALLLKLPLYLNPVIIGLPRHQGLLIAARGSFKYSTYVSCCTLRMGHFCLKSFYSNLTTIPFPVLFFKDGPWKRRKLQYKFNSLVLRGGKSEIQCVKSRGPSMWENTSYSTAKWLKYVFF